MVSLQELVRLAFGEPVTWVQGDPWKSRPIEWVAVSIQDVRGGDGLLLPVVELSEEILTTIRDLGVTVLFLLGSSDIPSLSFPEELAVVSLPGQGDIRACQRALLTVLINQRAGWIERGFSIHEKLSYLAVEGEGLDGLAKAMADVSRHGILVQDKRLRILAECPSSGLGGAWSEIIEGLKSLDRLPEPLQDRKLAGRQSLVYKQDIPGGLTRFVTAIRVGEVARGYLSLISLAGELDTLDQIVAEQGAMVCAVEMARSKAVHETEKRLKGNLLTALLQENLEPRDVRLWLQTMGLDLDHPYAALRFAWDSPSPPSRRRLETLVNGEVTRLGLKVIVNSMGAEVVCFCQGLPTTAQPEEALSLGQSVLQQAYTEYPDSPVRCGIGTASRDTSEWLISFRQAGQALEMARRLGERKALYFPDLSVFRLLMQIEHNPELIAFQEEILGPLLAHEGGRELIHTLEVYFEHNGNLSQTAEALFVHRNTLIYRLERIAEIAHMNLDLPETRLAVHLALHITRMRGNSK